MKQDFTLTSPDAAVQRLSSVANEAIPLNRPMEIVEAGCGRRSILRLDSGRCRITGVDLDEDALRARVESAGDLDRIVVGDVQDVSLLPRECADLVYSSFVLEHLPRAEEAARGHAAWLRPGGLLMIRVPDATSVYGFIASHTPHRLHVWTYRHVLGQPNAGTPGHAPYPVHYSRLTRMSGLYEFAAENNLDVIAALRFNLMPPRPGVRMKMARTACSLAAMLTRGRLTDEHTCLAIVLRKRTT
jgi:SAM-dependent methyltransferase